MQESQPKFVWFVLNLQKKNTVIGQLITHVPRTVHNVYLGQSSLQASKVRTFFLLRIWNYYIRLPSELLNVNYKKITFYHSCRIHAVISNSISHFKTALRCFLYCICQHFYYKMMNSYSPGVTTPCFLCFNRLHHFNLQA